MMLSQNSNFNELRHLMTKAYRMDETQCVDELLAQAHFLPEAQARINKAARALIDLIRKKRLRHRGLDSFLAEYDLSTEEGIILMSLAEALLRIPDPQTSDKLIRDKLSQANWRAHLGKSRSLLINAATLGLMISSKILTKQTIRKNSLTKTFTESVHSIGKSVIRTTIMQGMKILGKQFILGSDIEKAVKRARTLEKKGYRYSYDMLGEAARTEEDAEKYFRAYQHAIEIVGPEAKGATVYERAGISVKLSALHPRYEFAQRDRVIEEIYPPLKTLAMAAKKYNIGLTIDAEEADRLDLSLDILEILFADKDLAGWQGLGLAVQAYQKRAWYLIDWLVNVARKNQRCLMVRLVKGAYWDSEIKWAQERGLVNYPVFTRKENTDVSYLACAKKLAEFPKEIYPQFATHNAQTVASVMEIMGDRTDYEFQRLHGMGMELYDEVLANPKNKIACRIYAPVGAHADLLPYLVRRLLENGANTSFVNRIIRTDDSVEAIMADPVEKVSLMENKSHSNIPLPVNLYPDRKNSSGIDLSNTEELVSLKKAMEESAKKTWLAKPAKTRSTEKRAITSPNDRRHTIGYVIEASKEDLQDALTVAAKSAFAWNETSVETRADLLEKTADLIENHRADFLYLLIHEGGKCIPDALSEIREAADFCRYYAAEAREKLAKPLNLPGPTGENNQLQLVARGPVLCISPWNFPLAIFTGQVAAALVAGNPVLAKPAHQTPLVAQLCIDLFHTAGISSAVLQLLPASGRLISETLLRDERIKGVVMTGSTETACNINKVLAERKNEIIPLIAETGGQNAMIVDSSALPEQVIMDVLTSAFNSAGQRCSALRVLFLQEDIAEKFINLLKGAMQELVLGHSSLLSSDVGPIIDEAAKKNLQQHVAYLREVGQLVFEVPTSAATHHGNFFAPLAFEIADLKLLSNEVFGPILHIVRYKELDTVIAAINATQYGLTLGIQSRIDETVNYIYSRVRVGNCYVNRNMIGAVVGVQPFGGMGRSGTGPKAGGPHYLTRLTTERTLTINTSAAGGNTTLMTLQE